MSQSERFLVAFNKIEKYFDQEIQDSRYIPFHRAVQRLRKSNAVVDRYHNDLLEYSELRNAIVHERTEMNYVIAEPHEKVVQSIEGIANELTAPKLVIPAFSKTLKTVQLDLTVKDILAIIRETEFTQFPVYRSKQFIGLLTDKQILHWLAQNINGDCEGLLATSLHDVMKSLEERANYRFISKSTTVYEAEDCFMKSIRKHERLDALLITDEGKSNQRLLGLISPNDLINIP
ncbi:CBS domain-containing protein [Pelagirhabdus alkalitolerans]|uniref:CBS domain-containing protein n=1 Tax=Pelagirhabdus alkalitolerans TaxID=1612202 RepID=A0A1G6KLS0_9BACI|nr:CBS domain-containing protein [Pelagirhabdus alkalitolerans]SDC31867.1 CBS domain-containing protein [Pelagirhabdus alkalitolerans]